MSYVFCIFNIYSNYNCIQKLILNSLKKILFFTVFQIIMYNNNVQLLNLRYLKWEMRKDSVAENNWFVSRLHLICFSLPHVTIDVGN